MLDLPLKFHPWDLDVQYELHQGSASRCIIWNSCAQSYHFVTFKLDEHFDPSQSDLIFNLHKTPRLILADLLCDMNDHVEMDGCHG